MAQLKVFAFFFIQFCLAVARSFPTFSRMIADDEALEFSFRSISEDTCNLFGALSSFGIGGSARFGVPAVRVDGGDEAQSAHDAFQLESESFLYQYQRQLSLEDILEDLFEDFIEGSPQPDPETGILLDLSCSEGMCSSEDQTQLICDISDLRDDEELPLISEDDRLDSNPPDEGILTILDTPPSCVRLSTAENDEDVVLCSRREPSSSDSVVFQNDIGTIMPSETQPPLAGIGITTIGDGITFTGGSAPGSGIATIGGSGGIGFGRPFGTCCRPCSFLRRRKVRSLSCCMACSLL